MSPRPRQSAAFTVVVAVATALGALVMLLIFALSGAPAITLLAAVLAALPVGPLVAAYLWLDRYEPEPRGLLVSALAWGAFVSTASAIVIGGVGGLFVPITAEASLAIVAPVTEEASKGLFVLLLLWWRRHELDGILDGLVYAGLVGIGFAYTENILYLAAAYNGTEAATPGGLAGITATFVVRCLLSPFAHPLFTAFIGIGVGLAVASKSPATRILAPMGGYVLAVVTHALWNGSTIFGLGAFALVYVVIMIPALVGVVCLAIWARKSERTMLYAALTDAAQRNLLPAEDIGWLVDIRARRAARAQARQRGGPALERLMSQYQQEAIELGFLHDRMLRGTPPRDWQPRGAAHVERIWWLRPQIDLPSRPLPPQVAQTQAVGT